MCIFFFCFFCLIFFFIKSGWCRKKKNIQNKQNTQKLKTLLKKQKYSTKMVQPFFAFFSYFVSSHLNKMIRSFDWFLGIQTDPKLRSRYGYPCMNYRCIFPEASTLTFTLPKKKIYWKPLNVKVTWKQYILNLFQFFFFTEETPIVLLPVDVLY